MSYESTIATALKADATLVAILTGGVYSYGETKRLGIGIDTTPNAYLNGFLRPCAVVKGRAEVATNEIVDTDTQYATARQVVEVWLYNDGDSGYTALEIARERIYALLHRQHFTGIVSVMWAGNIDNERDKELHNACLLRQDWQVRGEKSV